MLSEGNKYLEQNLETPVRDLLERMQKETFNSRYFGVPVIKSPMDFMVCMEIVYEVRPDVVVEVGNACGGMTLALAHMLDNMGRGRVVGVDTDHSKIPEVVRNHSRITLITGDACGSFPNVRNLIGPNNRVLVIEDSSHTYENTLNVLRTYNSLVSEGSYFIVEDSIINHGLNFPSGFQQGGPYEAIEVFLRENDNFMIDRTRERFVITWNPKGYLKRIK